MQKTGRIGGGLGLLVVAVVLAMVGFAQFRREHTLGEVNWAKAAFTLAVLAGLMGVGLIGSALGWIKP